MKLSQAALLLLSMFGGYAVAADTNLNDQGHGSVKFVGAIIDAPCSIAPESVDQTVQMGQIASSLLQNGGASPLRPFEIHLEDCDLTTAMNATVTFNGIASDSPRKGMAFSLNGGGGGGALTITNQYSGDHILIGQPTKVTDLVNGDNHLKFGARIIREISDASEIVPGDFDVSTDFVMTYQ